MDSPPRAFDSLLPYFKGKRQLVTFATPNVRLLDRSLRFRAKSSDAHSALKHGTQRSRDTSAQLEVLTSIRALNSRNRARGTQVWGPVLAVFFQQAAFFDIAAAMVVTIKIFAFFSIWGFHKSIARALTLWLHIPLCEYQFE